MPKCYLVPEEYSFEEVSVGDLVLGQRVVGQKVLVRTKAGSILLPVEAFEFLFRDFPMKTDGEIKLEQRIMDMKWAVTQEKLLWSEAFVKNVTAKKWYRVIGTILDKLGSHEAFNR